VTSLTVSTQTEEAFGFGLRDVDAFATVEQPFFPSVVDPMQSWGIVTGDFSPDSILDALAQCGECEPAEVDSIVANQVYSWGDGQSFSEGLRNTLPIFDSLGRGGTMAFFDNRVIRTSGLDQMRVMLESRPIASDPAWTRAAQIFDEAGTLYAHFQTVDELSGGIPDFLEPMQLDIAPADAASLPSLAPYRFMALGGGAEDGVPFSVLLLAFEDAATADANVDAVRERLEAIPDGASPQQWGDPEIVDVASDGALVVVRLEGRALGGLHLWMMQTVLSGLPPAAP